LQLSGASLAACGLHVALERLALAETPDPANEEPDLCIIDGRFCADTSTRRIASDEPDLLIIDGLTEAANDPDVQQYIRTGAWPFWVAGIFVNVWRTNLNFMSVPPDLVSYYRQAGVASRDLAGAQSIWETIPRQVRMGGPQALRDFHSTRDWSHFIPRSQGGGDSAAEGIFEDRILNRIRGPKPMTDEEIAAARMALRTQAVKDAIGQTARVTVSGALVGSVTAGVFAVMEYGLSYQEGKIDRAEIFDLVWKESSAGVAVGIGITGIIAGLVMIFPALTAVISPFVLPLAFVSFALVGYQFYAAAKSWKDAGFDPLLGAWVTSKEISKEAWTRSATLFEEFQNAAESAWAETTEAAQRVINWFRVKLSPVDTCDYSPVEIYDYPLVDIYDYRPVKVCD